MRKFNFKEVFQEIFKDSLLIFLSILLHMLCGIFNTVFLAVSMFTIFKHVMPFNSANYEFIFFFLLLVNMKFWLFLGAARNAVTARALE